MVNSQASAARCGRVHDLWCQTDVAQFHALSLFDCVALGTCLHLRSLLYKTGITILNFQCSWRTTDDVYKVLGPNPRIYEGLRKW